MRARHRERLKPSISMRHPPAPVARFLSRARRRVRVPRARRRVRVPRARRRLLSLPRQFTLRAHQPFAHLDPHPTLNLQRARTRPRVLQRLRQRRSRVFHVRPALRLHRAHHVVPRLQLPSQRLHAPRERRARITHAHHGSRARRCAPMRLTACEMPRERFRRPARARRECAPRWASPGSRDSNSPCTSRCRSRSRRRSRCFRGISSASFATCVRPARAHHACTHRLSLVVCRSSSRVN